MPDSMHRRAGIFSRWRFSRERENTLGGSVLRAGSALEEQLQREAWTERPRFSADLHRQICHAVKHAAPHVTREPVIARHHDVGLKLAWFSSQRIRIAWESLALAGVLVLAGWVVRWDGLWTSADVPASYVTGQAESAGRMGNPVASLTTLATLPDQATGRIEQWLQATMADRQWAYLGHDARLVTQWLMEELPWKVPAGDAELDGSS